MKKGFIDVRANHIRKPAKLTIPVLIIGERVMFGRTDYLIMPIGGEGQAWVMGKRVKDISEYQQESRPYDYVDNGGKE